MTEDDIERLAQAIASHIAPLPSPKLIDGHAAAEQLGVPATWILAEARANRIPHVRLGRYVRFDPRALDAWIIERQ